MHLGFAFGRFGDHAEGMASGPLVAVVVVVIFAGASFFFALAETALFSLSKWQVRQLAERAPGAGATVARLLAEPQDLLATMVLGNTFASAAMLAVALWMAIHGHWPLAATVVGLLALILVGCEVLPKTLAVRRPEQWSLRLARPLSLVVQFSLPLCRVAQVLNAAILRTVTSRTIQSHFTLTDADYQELLELAYQQGTLAQSEKEIILQIISLDRRTAREVMKPRSRMAAISDDLSIEDMIAAARKYRHRRLPIYDETPDTIVGILNTRALLLDPQIDLADAIEFPSFVPETMNLLQQESIATLACVFTGRTHAVPASAVVLVTSRVSDEALYRALVGEDAGAPPRTSPQSPPASVQRIGDCLQPALIAAAVYSGHRVARELGLIEPARPRERVLI